MLGTIFLIPDWKDVIFHFTRRNKIVYSESAFFKPNPTFMFLAQSTVSIQYLY